MEVRMAKPLLPDALWANIKPLLPTHAPSPKGGRPRLDDRKALTGILFVLKTGLPWEDLPAEMSCGSGMSCWRRLRRSRQAGPVRGDEMSGRTCAAGDHCPDRGLDRL